MIGGRDEEEEETAVLNFDAFTPLERRIEDRGARCFDLKLSSTEPGFPLVLLVVDRRATNELEPALLLKRASLGFDRLMGFLCIGRIKPFRARWRGCIFFSLSYQVCE